MLGKELHDYENIVHLRTQFQTTTLNLRNIDRSSMATFGLRIHCGHEFSELNEPNEFRCSADLDSC